MKLSFTEPVCSGGSVLPLPRECPQLRFVMKVSLVYICLMIATLQLLASNGSGQNLDQLKVTTELDHESLSNLFQQIQRQTSLTFAFIPNEISPYNNITLAKGTRSVKATLELAFYGTGLGYEQVNSSVIISVGATSASASVEASASVIQGTVKDNEGAAMPGVNIVVKGTTSGTTTDGDGRFVIDARASDILVFSFIGYKPQEVEVGARSSIDIVLESDIEALKEVVVNAGYYQTTDKMKTGSIVRVDAKDIGTQPVTSLLMALQGRMAGVDVTPQNGVPGSAVKIQIRGLNSLRMGGDDGNGNIPLYIVDGVPIDSRPLTPVSSTLVGEGFDPLSTINPSNIESIEVLKDADATAIYGSRGANGVVLITTKRAAKVEKTNLEFGVYKGVGRVYRRMELLDTKHYLEMRREAFANDGSLPGSIFPDNDLLQWDTTRYTDWQKKLIGGTANILDAQLAISGGGATTSFRISGGLHKEGLVFPGDFGYHKLNGGVSLNHLSSNQKFKGTLSINYGIDNNKLFDDTEVMNSALTLAPNAPELYTPTGELNWENSTWINPLSGFRKTYNVVNNNLIANSNLSYDVIKGLTFKVNLGYTNLDATESARYPISANDPAFSAYSTGSTADGGNKRQSWIVEPQIMFHRNFNNGELSIVGGSTWQSSTYQSQSYIGEGYTSDVLLGNIKAANSVTFVRNEKSEYRYTALFGRIGYNLDGKYFINFTGRRDGSSRFGPNNRFANFGALGVAWVFSNENFIQDNLPFLNFSKIRASYGTTGNDQIGDYKFYNTYLLGNNKYQNIPSLYPKSLYNPNFAWEVTKKFELALEFSVIDNRISAEIDWYRNTSSNQLIQYTLPFTTGFQSVLSNLNAKVQNAGWEIAVRGDNIVSDRFKWNTSINFSLPQNKLVEFPNIEKSPYAALYSIGEPLSIVKLYKLLGVNKETGLYEFQDENGDGSMDDQDKLQYVNYGKVWYAGITNSFRYKSFELNFLIQLAKQNVQNYSYPWPGMQANQPAEVMDRWQTDNNIGRFQRFNQDFSSASTYYQFINSTGIVGNGSFIRLKTASFSYQIPEVFCAKLKLQSARLYIQGQNIFTITKYKGLDPESGSALPPLRMLTTGIQVKI